MRPCWTRNGRKAIGPPAPSTANGPSIGSEVEDRRVEAARRLHEDVGEARDQHLGGLGVGPDRQAGAAVVDDGAEVVDAVDVVGVRVGVDDAVEQADVGGEELRAQVGGGVDQHPGGAAAGWCARASSEQRLRRFLGFGRVAGAPVAADARHAGRGAAAEDGGAQPRASCQPPWSRTSRLGAASVRSGSVWACRDCVRHAGDHAAAFGEQPVEVRRGERGELGRVEAEVRGHEPGGVGDVGGLVALAAVRLRREVGAVGLDEQPVARARRRRSRAARRRCGRSRCRRSTGRSRATSAVSASAAAGGEAVHDAGEGAGGVLLGEDAADVGVGVAGVDDQRQAGPRARPRCGGAGSRPARAALSAV